MIDCRLTIVRNSMAAPLGRVQPSRLLANALTALPRAVFPSRMYQESSWLFPSFRDLADVPGADLVCLARRVSIGR